MSENTTIQNWKQFDSKYKKDDVDSKFAIQLSDCTNLGFLFIIKYSISALIYLHI
jgi:hypothetical protein